MPVEKGIPDDASSALLVLRYDTEAARVLDTKFCFCAIWSQLS